jgi:SIR2-like protein
MKYYALLGAGFSRNWGGWLASEVFEYLLGWGNLSPGTRDLLWSTRNDGGFEAALEQLQRMAVHTGTADAETKLDNFQAVLREMFRDMDHAFERQQFEFQNEARFMVRSFLSRFDAIFTLNQDVLLERFYMDGNLSLSVDRTWDCAIMPGMRPSFGMQSARDRVGNWEATTGDVQIRGREQPIIKLHGSSNWLNSGKRDLMVMGANKSEMIARFPVLKWGFDYFTNALIEPASHLMVIGYGFHDEHINAVIKKAAEKRLRMFVIDPLGVEVMDRRRLENEKVMIKSEDDFFQSVKSSVAGASRRSLSETFGGSKADFGKVMRFMR